MSFAGITAARKRLADLATRLRTAASGEVVRRAAEKVGDLVRKVATTKLEAHEESGRALSATVVDVDGGLVELHGMPPCNGVKWSGKSYVSTKVWWPFRGGVMPPFVLKAAALIFARELLAVLGRGGAGLDVATMVEEADAAETARNEKRQAAEDRRIDRRIKAQEAREEKRGKAQHKREQAAEKRALERSREQFKRDVARIWRQSAAGKAARAAARKSARAST